MNEWQNAERHAERAYDHYQSGHWDKALAELKQALAVNPNQSEWHFGMGLTLDAMQRYAEAATCFQRVLKLRGDDIETLLLLAINLIQCDRCHKALRMLARIHKIKPDHEPAYCYEILAHARLGQHDQAEQTFYMARQIVDQCPVCYHHMAQSLASVGQYDRAIWCWRQTLRIDPTFPDVLGHLGRTYWANGQLEQSHKLFLQQIKQTPDDTDSLLDLGNLLLEMRCYAEADEKFHLALEHEPALAEAHLHLGELALLTDHLDSAQAQLQTALRLDDDLSGVHLRLAEVARRRGDRVHVSHHLKQELKRRQNHPDQVLKLAGMLIDVRMTGPAIELLTPLINDPARRTLHDDNRLATALLHRGVAQIFDGNPANGVPDCRAAVRLDANNATAMHNLVLAYLDMHRCGHARYWLHRMEALPPQKRTLRTLRRLHLRLIKLGLTTALRRWLACLNLRPHSP